MYFCSLGLSASAGVDVADRALSLESAGQDHHPGEMPRRVVRCPRMDRVGTGLEPRIVFADFGRLAMNADVEAALEQTAYAAALMSMGIGNAAGWKLDLVAAEQVAVRIVEPERCFELAFRADARAGGVAFVGVELVTKQARSPRAGCDRERTRMKECRVRGEGRGRAVGRNRNHPLRHVDRTNPRRKRFLQRGPRFEIVPCKAEKVIRHALLPAVSARRGGP